MEGFAEPEVPELMPGMHWDNLYLQEYLDQPIGEKKTFRAVYTPKVGNHDPVDIVLKVLGRTDEVDPLVKKRHHRIYEALSGRAHSNLPLCMAVSNKQGTDYLMLEYIPGRTLEDNIVMWDDVGVKRRMRDAVTIHGGIACALQHLHDKGIAHRNVNPRNIIIARNDEVAYDVRAPIRRVVLVGFGSSKRQEGNPAESLEIDINPFRAPEAYGKGMNESSDVYALGKCLYASIMRNPHPPHDARLHTAMYPGLDHICNSMLAVDPDARPPLDEVIMQLSSLLGKSSNTFK